MPVTGNPATREGQSTFPGAATEAGAGAALTGSGDAARTARGGAAAGCTGVLVRGGRVATSAAARTGAPSVSTGANASIRNRVIVKPAYSSGASTRSLRPCSAI